MLVDMCRNVPTVATFLRLVAVRRRFGDERGGAQRFIQFRHPIQIERATCEGSAGLFYERNSQLIFADIEIRNDSSSF